MHLVSRIIGSYVASWLTVAASLTAVTMLLACESTHNRISEETNESCCTSFQPSDEDFRKILELTLSRPELEALLWQPAAGTLATEIVAEYLPEDLRSIRLNDRQLTIHSDVERSYTKPVLLLYNLNIKRDTARVRVTHDFSGLEGVVEFRREPTGAWTSSRARLTKPQRKYRCAAL